jgi:hypothetical protein
MAARDIKDKESLERWLSGRPIEDAQVIALRAALRAMATMDDLYKEKGVGPTLLLTCFRLVSAAYAELLHPGLGCRAATIAASVAAKNCVDSLHHHAKEDVRTATIALQSIHCAAQSLTGPPQELLNAATMACEYAAAAAGARGNVRFLGTRNVKLAAEFAATIWESIESDTIDCELRDRTEPVFINSWALFPSKMLDAEPQLNYRRILNLEYNLYNNASVSERWSIWADWYLSRDRGDLVSQAYLTAHVLGISEAEWAAGPAVANSKIALNIKHARKEERKGRRAHQTTRATPPEIAVPPTQLGFIGPAPAPLFISHASQADGARARALVEALEAAGQPCWIAPRDIAAGADWNGSILGAIESCGGVVLLVSPASVASPFVKAEIQHAFEHKKRVVPVRLAEAQPSLLDLRLKTVQHIEADGDFSLVVRAVVVRG